MQRFARQMSTVAQRTAMAFQAPEPSNEAQLRRESNVRALVGFLRQHWGSVAVLTGAGLSTESALPDYRSPLGAYSRGHAPMTYQAFVAHSALSSAVGDEEAVQAAQLRRQRYWLRSYLGFAAFSQAAPNAGHEAVAALQGRGVVDEIVTQNVDRLHHRSGAERVLELHGNLFSVECLACRRRYERTRVQAWLRELNADLLAGADVQLAGDASRPDGDAAVVDVDPARFRLADCPHCRHAGLLKPAVVFFGESIPPHVVAHSYAVVERASALLVLGSSLEVASARRLVRRANELRKPVVVVNIGATKADDVAQLKIEDRLSAVLQQAVHLL